MLINVLFRMPSNVSAGNYLLGTFDLHQGKPNPIRYSARYTIVDWGKKQNKALSTVIIEKKKTKSTNFGENEMNG